MRKVARGLVPANIHNNYAQLYLSIISKTLHILIYLICVNLLFIIEAPPILIIHATSRK